MQDLLISANLSAVPTASRIEGIRQALGQINAAFTAKFTISGLDGAVDTSLPESYDTALLLGASAFILDFSIRSRFIGYHDTPEVSEKLVPWAEKMKEEFQAALDRLRVVELQQTTNPPAFQIPDDDNDYDLSVDQ